MVAKLSPSSISVYQVCNHRQSAWMYILHLYYSLTRYHCILYADSMVQTCTDAPDEAKVTAYNLISN